MIRKITICLLSLSGGGLLLVGCAGQCLDAREWACRPTSCRGFVWIGSRSIGGELLSIGSQATNSTSETCFYQWLDKSFVDEAGMKVRRRFLLIPAWCMLAVAAPLLVYPAVVFVRGPYRRYCRRRKGCCLQCGYNLTGNVSGICPECGRAVFAQHAAQPDSRLFLGNLAVHLSSLAERFARAPIWWVALAAAAITILSILPPRGEYGRYLPAVVLHPWLVAAVVCLAVSAVQRIWLEGRVLAWTGLCVLAVFLMYYVLLYYR